MLILVAILILVCVGGGCVNTGGHINISGGNYLVSITFK